MSMPPPAAVPIETPEGLEVRDEDLVIMSDAEAGYASAPNPEPNGDAPAPIPDEIEAEVSDTELPAAIDEESVPDEDVPDEEKQPEAVVEDDDEEEETVEAPVPVSRPVMPRQSYSPVSEQQTTAPRLGGLGQATPMSDTAKILILVGGLVAVGVAIYFLKKG